MSETKYQKFPTIKNSMLPKHEILTLMPEELIKEFNAFPFEKDGDTVYIAAVNPDNADLKAFVQKRFNDIKWFLADKKDIDAVLAKFIINPAQKEILQFANNHNINNDIVALVDKVIASAITQMASDIHIEPMRDGTAVRFRLDGILYSVLTVPKAVHPAVVARFKILANLKLDEYRRPQDGRIELEHFKNISMRLSTIPTLYGEKIAIRILDDSNEKFNIDDLGFSDEHKAIIRRNIEKPFGMIVASGPTGSGKTTTLYGLLNLIRRDGLNISTLEDPIEYSFHGINQVQINPKVDLTFTSGLRALLRQDPDIIMVGEIRDSDTTIMASNAALTGHLVLTTIHTNDAPSTFSRFLEMRVEDFIVGSIINLVIAQRLVRTVCTKCVRKIKLDKTMLKKIRDRKDILKSLQKTHSDLEQILALPFAYGKGCDKCLGTGYAGRIGIFELMELNKTLHDLVLNHASADALKAAAEGNGFKDMIADGLDKVLKGITTFDEVVRTTRNA